MKLPAIALIAALALLAGASALPAGMAGAQASKPIQVGTDPEGDWGAAVDPELAPFGDALAQDLIEALIGMGDADTVNFIIKVTNLPPTGGWPEVTRYTWDMNVDGEFVELDGKFTNYSRGSCDPTSGQCPPPRDPGMGPFLVRGNCAPAEGTNVTLCEELGIVEGLFDASTGEITIPVPMDLINAKVGTVITGGANIFGGSISASPAAFLTSGSFPMDTMVILGTFTIPDLAPAVEDEVLDKVIKPAPKDPQPAAPAEPVKQQPSFTG